MRYIICHPREIESTARRLTNQLLRDGSSLGIVLECMISTAASKLQYTRSLALVAKQIIEHLKSRGSSMASIFQEEIRDMSLAVFIRHFMDPFKPGAKEARPDDNIVPGVMPLAISSFIGDLASLGLITFTAFDACMSFLMKRVRTRLHIRCLRYLLGHAGARHLPQITISYVRDCARVVRKQADQHLQCYSLEEDELRELMKDIATRPIDAEYRQEWDPRLDLEMALQASVVLPPSYNCRDLSMSPNGSESGMSTPTNPTPTSSRSNASLLTVSPATSLGSAESTDQATTGKVVTITAASVNSADDDSPGAHKDKAKTAEKDYDSTSTPLVIHAPRPIRPAQFQLWL